MCTKISSQCSFVNFFFLINIKNESWVSPHSIFFTFNLLLIYGKKYAILSSFSIAPKLSRKLSRALGEMFRRFRTFPLPPSASFDVHLAPYSMLNRNFQVQKAFKGFCTNKFHLAKFYSPSRAEIFFWFVSLSPKSHNTKHK